MTAKPLIAKHSNGLHGTCKPPGDKSISHRAIMFGGIADGKTTVRGLLEGDDVLATVAALRALGAKITREASATEDSAVWTIIGNGGELSEPAGVVDMGNSGTSARLLIGILAVQPFVSIMTGDASLVNRPMERVITPLSQTGATFLGRSKQRLPIAISGSATPSPINYHIPVASAQVKSSILLAGLFAHGTTTVYEPVPTRDHTERLLRSFGAQVDVTHDKDGLDTIKITGPTKLRGIDIVVPADISSAAFPLVAALLVPESHVTLTGVGINPRRNGLIISLKEMGAKIELVNEREVGGEPVADIVVQYSNLHGITVPPERAASMIDEYPILAVAASCASGTTYLRGLDELRHKESDRLTLMANGLAACGAKVVVEGDDMIIHGSGIPPKGGATVKTHLDHRIAMSFLVLGLASEEPVTIDDSRTIATSFPNFIDLMTKLGAELLPVGDS